MKQKTTRRTGGTQPFPIVGIGASAGGLEAFTELLRHFPADTGMGLVLVQHLDPSHESELTRLLARATTMPTREVTNKLRVEPNRVYVIPPNVNMAIVKGVLKLEPRPEGRKPQHAIDFFFESLAADQRERAIGVILSGTATDGTLGLEAIKAEGGITFAQDESAKYDSMPRSAAAAGCVDFVLSPENIAKELARIAKHPYVGGSPAETIPPDAPRGNTRDSGERERETSTTHQDDATALPSGGHGTPAVGAKQARVEAERDHSQPEDDGFKKILLLLRNHCGVDFSFYKSATIQRRIARRMVLGKHDGFGDYARFLRGNAKELDTLFSDVLISVTSFFRNPEAFDILKRVVFPKLLKQRHNEVARVWVLGCSTGQEAYSIGMAFSEFVENVPRAPKLQIFATDLNDALLDKARAGLYATSLAADISPERLRRFFVEEEGGYRVIKTLREAVVFARQNLITDPPFSRMDLICCRNLLIYLEPVLQRKALAGFHYALKPEGFLFLGASESVGQFADLFETVDKKQKIYSKKPVATPSQALYPVRPQSAEKKRRPVALPRALPEGLRTELTTQREADRLMVNEFAPPGVLINAELQILQFRGPTGDYLTPPRGKASFDVLKMAREGLMLPLRAAINKAKKEHTAVRKENVRLDENGSTRMVTIQVSPLKNLKERCYLILFEEVPQSPGEEVAGQRRRGRGADALPTTRALSSAPLEAGRVRGEGERPGMKALRQRLAESERELAETRDYLQAIQEQYDAANEELQASSEEAQSANEELQSINEELETSKEELESTNEELTTINEELGNRNTELGRLAADLNNLHVSIHTAILVLGRDLTIRRFTPLAEKTFNLLAADVGRPLSGIRHNLLAPLAASPKGMAESPALPLDLENLVREVIDTVSVREHEVEDKQGRWYSLRVRPYLTLDNKIDGAVVALVDIDALKRHQRESEIARNFAEATIGTMPIPLLVLDGDLRVKTTNEAFYRTFKVNPLETEGRLIYELGNRQWNIPALRTLLEDILPRNGFFNDFELTHEFQSVGRRTMLLKGRRLDTEAGLPDLIFLAIEDITERKRAEEALRDSEERFRTLFDSTPMAVFVCDRDAVIQTYNRRAAELWGRKPECGVEKHCGSLKLFLPDGTLLPHEQSPMVDVLRTGTPAFNVEVSIERPDGSRISVLVNFAPLKDAQGGITGAVTSFIDITERKQAEDALRHAGERFRLMAETMPQKMFTATPSGDVDYFNPQWIEFTGLTFEQIRDWGWTQFIHPDDVAENVRVWKHSIATGEPFQLEHRFRRADGEYRWHLSRAAALKHAKGQPLMWVGSNTDIHDVKESDQRKDEFLALLAHELRNPLAPIGNALQILRQTGGAGETGKPAIDMLQRQFGHVVRLVDDLLDVSRISRGQIALHRERVELASVVNHAVETTRPHSDSMEQELTVTLPPRPIYLNADPTRLAQIVGNLLNNASKFTERGGRIRLTVERDNAQAVISVQDTGIGVAAEHLPRIFEMFMQVDTSLEHAQQGLGIGLSLVKKLVEMHDGSIEAHSGGLAKGAEFVVRLPILTEPAPAPLEPIGIQRAAPVPRRILVVDDNLDAANSLAMLLSLSGHDVHTAHDGLEAVEAAAKLQPDVILLDIGLPKLNGYEAARRIRQQQKDKGVILVALTGWGQDEDKLRSQEAGFDFHVVKPVDPLGLEKILGSRPALATRAP